jgi:hypothetical protein
LALALGKEPSSSSQRSSLLESLRYILFSVFGFLLVRSFSSSYSQTPERVGAVNDTHETGRQGQQPAQEIRIRAELTTPEHIERQRTANDNRNYSLQKWLVWGTWLAFLAAGVYAGISLRIWHEMQVQTRIQREAYVTSQRPWVKVKNRIAKPLTFDTPAWKGPVANATIEDILENTGTTVALNVLFWEDIIPLDSDGPRYTAALKRRSEWCDANRHPDLHAPSGFMLFPKDPMVQQSSVGPPMETVIKAANANSSSGLVGKVGFVLVGCIAYRSSFEPKTDPTHQTRFIYLLGQPVDGGTMPYVVPKGTAGSLQLIQIPDGFSAD